LIKVKVTLYNEIKKPVAYIVPKKKSGNRRYIYYYLFDY